MKSEQQRIAIAEACGWRAHETVLDIVWYPPNLHPLQNVFGHTLPDYLNDLNAMHEAEQMLRRKYGHLSGNNLHRNYLMRLMQLLNPGVKLWDNGTFLGDWANVIVMAEATAAQRAEAFLKTLGKWDAAKQTEAA